MKKINRRSFLAAAGLTAAALALTACSGTWYPTCSARRMQRKKSFCLPR